MRKDVPTNNFRKDVKKLLKRGWYISRMLEIIDIIKREGNAPAQCRPHKLKGEWKDCWECHVAPDWLLIYTVDDKSVTLYRTGSHSDLFE